MGLLSALRGRGIGKVLTATDGRDVLLNDPDGWEVTQPFLWWMGPAGSDGTGGPWGNPIPGANGDPYGLTTLPSVCRCTSIICDTIGGLPWRVMRGYEQLPTPDWIADPQALRLDGRVIDAQTIVDVRLSAVEFWTQWAVAALWFGDGFVYVPSRDTNGQPKPPLYQLHPHYVEVDDREYFVNGEHIPSENIIHLRGAPPYVDGRGSGVIDRNAADLGLAATVRGYAQGVYTTGVPSGYLKANAPNLQQTQADKLKTDWMKAHGSGTVRTVAVLNATTEYVPISLSPVDAGLNDAKTWTMRDVALAFGVPSYMLGIPGDSATYANVESRMIELRTFTLLPWIRRIESTLDAQFARGVSVKVATDALLRADTKTRYDSYAVGLSNGFLTVDEVRAYEDLPPLVGAANG